MTVEMEAAAMFAVAWFRGMQIGQLLRCGDEKLLWLAIHACAKLQDEGNQRCSKQS